MDTKTTARAGGAALAVSFESLEIRVLMFAPAASAVPVDIWPLGDSLTYGAPPGGYRTELYQDLANAGYKVQFVGTSTTNPSPALAAAGQTQHDGHCGYRIDQISANLDGSDNSTATYDTNHGGYWLTGGNGGTLVPKTDVILLLAGANDIYQHHDVANAPQRLDALIGKITSLRPQADLIVSNVTPSLNGSDNDLVQTFDAAIPGIVAKYASQGKHVFFVDQYKNFVNADGTPDASLYVDKLHPTDVGCKRMGDTFFSAIQAAPLPASVESIPAPPSNVPANLLATPLGHGQIKLTWTGPAYSNFVIERSASPDGTWTALPGFVSPLNSSQQTFIDNNLRARHRYYYRVIAVHRHTASAPSNIASARA